jgi:NAD+ synthase (glutamine-hydrolysing)
LFPGSILIWRSRVIALDGNIILIRPKLWLANEGNYHETRYFDAWSKNPLLS